MPSIAVAESGRNPGRKHQIDDSKNLETLPILGTFFFQTLETNGSTGFRKKNPDPNVALCVENGRADAGTGWPNPSREIEFSGANGDRGKHYFPSPADHVIHTLLNVMTISIYIQCKLPFTPCCRRLCDAIGSKRPCKTLDGGTGIGRL